MMMKKAILIILVIVTAMTAVFCVARHRAGLRADAYAQSLLDRGWYTARGRFGIGGGTCGWVFSYYRPEDSNCFPPFVQVTWRGNVAVQSSSDPKVYADKYDAWLAEQKTNSTETTSAEQGGGTLHR